MRRRLVLTGGFLAAVVAVTVVVTDVTPPAPELTPDPTSSWPGWGFTHTQYSADAGAPAATQSVEEALRAQPLVQAQAIMGWGANNPEPSPGHYDFVSLDSRIDLIRKSGGIPVLTLCCAPDWMKGGKAGKTNWDRLAGAPLPEHYADFAALAGVIATRYPDVHYFLVWNELKGFWNEEANTWDAAGYTDFYNQVYDAVRSASPGARIGGPYLPLNDTGDGAVGPGDTSSAAGQPAAALQGAWGSVDPRVLSAFAYWLAHKRGADFVVVDGEAWAQDKTVDPFAAVQMFSAVNRWIQQRTDLPIWWAEWYLDPAVKRWPADRQLAAYTVAMMELTRSRTHTALYWNPRPQGPSCAACLWTDTTKDGGGTPLALLTVLQNFGRWFPPGTPLRPVPAAPGVQVLAQSQVEVAVNTTGSPQSLAVDGQSITLSPYEIRWITGP
ncbi:MAG: hypothetical protein JWO98_3114 [Frankiales bacterium]|nr:hypothetical protein [Frankiales bacterium]